MTNQSIPFILCGKREEIGSAVINGVKPEYEAIHFIMSLEDGLTNIPLLLSGSHPKDPLSQIGSGDYSRVPQAVILGGGFTAADIDQLRQAALDNENARKVPWLKANLQKTAEGPEMGTEGYAQTIPARVREAMSKLAEEGKFDGHTDGIFSW